MFMEMMVVHREDNDLNTFNLTRTDIEGVNANKIEPH